MTDTITKFGTSFQNKVLTLMVSDREFMEQTYDIIKPEYFESEGSQWVAETALGYFSKFKTLPTMDVFKIERNNIPESRDGLRSAVTEQLRHVYQAPDMTDSQYVQEVFIDFCKNQTLKSAILDSADLLKTGQYDKIKSIIDKAMNAGLERGIGHNWREDIAKRTEEMARSTVATPWACINRIMDGGLAPGELGVVVAPAGAGKSWLLTSIGAHAVKAGKRVAHYTLELNENYVGLRYDTIYTGVEPNEIRNNLDKVREVVDSIAGELIIKFYPTRTVTIHALQAHIQRMSMVGYKPDLVIIDYADLLRPTQRSNARYEELGYIYEEVRGLGGECNVPVWTASQSQRSSTQEDVIEADKIAESFSKIMISDFVMSWSRKLNDKAAGTARAHVIKNRFGPDGITFPARMDVTTGTVNIVDPNSPEGQALKNNMAGAENIVKQALAKKLKELG